jgi:hypothetical protein
VADALIFVATVEKVQTMQDGAIRLTLDLPETAISEMAALAECRRQGMVLRFEATEAEPVGSVYSHYKKDGKNGKAE